MLLRIGSVLILSITYVFAQLGASSSSSSTADPRVKAVFEKAGIKYTTDKDGDYRVVNQVDSTRTQLAWVRSQTSQLGSLEVRDVLSVAGKIQGQLSPELARRLLEWNNRVKVGAWAIEYAKGETIIVFKIQVAADTDVLPLLLAIHAATTTADELEKELTGSADEY